MTRQAEHCYPWLDPGPAASLFGPAELAVGGKRMTLPDLNNGPDTRGAWEYRLSLGLDGQVYPTCATLPIDTSTNPSIKNN